MKPHGFKKRLYSSALFASAAAVSALAIAALNGGIGGIGAHIKYLVFLFILPGAIAGATFFPRFLNDLRTPKPHFLKPALGGLISTFAAICLSVIFISLEAALFGKGIQGDQIIIGIFATFLLTQISVGIIAYPVGVFTGMIGYLFWRQVRAHRQTNPFEG